MTVEMRPIGVACNLKCTYCYENSMRAAGNISRKYNLDKMLERVSDVDQAFSLFGGEALLVPKKDLERLWSYSFEKFGETGVQTNGVLIDDDHVEMFKKYNVHVGISIDGPGELNDLRVAGSLEETREATNKTLNNIQRLRDEGVGVGIIITLHKLNSTGDNLQKLKNFISWLSSIGIKGGNIHTLEVDEPIIAEKYCLDEDENAAVFVELARFLSEDPELHWNPFAEIPRLLRGDDTRTLCYWNSCDPFNTQAVHGIEGDGSLSNCSRTNKEGVDWIKTEGPNSFARYIAFYHTPDEYGGCQGCRFWSICGGSCPGESNSGDFRNKTMHCKTQKALLGFYEKRLMGMGIKPITQMNILPLIERMLLDGMGNGNPPSLKRAFEEAQRINQQRQKESEKQMQEEMKIQRVEVIN